MHPKQIICVHRIVVCLYVMYGIAIELVSNYTRIQIQTVAPESTPKKKVATQRRRRNSLRTTKASYYSCKVQSPLGQGTMFLIFSYMTPSQVFTLQVFTCFLNELLLQLTLVKVQVDYQSSELVFSKQSKLAPLMNQSQC